MSITHTPRQNTQIIISVDHKRAPAAFKPIEDRCRTIIKETELSHLSPDTVNPTTVNVKYGWTINLGNYETSRIDVGISRSCDPDKEEACYEDLKGQVEEYLQKEITELKSALKAKKK